MAAPPPTDPTTDLDVTAEVRAAVDDRAAEAVEDTSTFRSLRTRNFRLFFLGQLVSQTGTWLSMVVQTLLVLKLDGSGITLGLLVACQFGPVLLLGAWAGAIADRADKRRLLLIVQGLSMVQSAALGIVILAGWASVPVIFALAAVQGVLTAFDNPTRRAFVVEMVPHTDVSNAVSLNSAVMTASRVVGPALAGVLVVNLGYGWPFLIDALSYVAVLVGLVMMRPAELFRSTPTAKGKGQVVAGLRYVRSEPVLFVPLVMMTIVGTLAFNFSVTVPLLVKGTLGGSTTTFTLLFSALSLGSLVGALLTARRTDVTTTQVVVSSAAFGVGMLALAVVPSLVVAFPVAILLGLGSIGFLTSTTALVQLRAAPEYRGRVLALQGMVFLGSTPIGGPLVGWISDVGGPRAGIALGGFACLAAAAYGARALGLRGTVHGDRADADETAELVDELVDEVALAD